METTTKNSVNNPVKGTVIYNRRTITLDPKNKTKAGMSDAYINYQSSKAAANKYNNSPMRDIGNALFVGLPIAHSVVVGALSGDTVAKKAKATAGTMKNWGIFIAAISLFNTATNAVINKVPAFKKFKEENPASTTLGTIVVGCIAGSSAINHANKLFSKIGETKSGKWMEDSTVNTLKKSPLNKEGVKNFIDKFMFKPTQKVFGNKNGSKAFAIGAYALLGGLITGEFVSINNARNTQKTVKDRLERERAQAKQGLIKNITLEQARFNILDTSRAGLN